MSRELSELRRFVIENVPPKAMRRVLDHFVYRGLERDAVIRRIMEAARASAREVPHSRSLQAPCPLCGGKASDPRAKGFAMPAGLELHLDGKAQVNGCRVFEAASALALEAAASRADLGTKLAATEDGHAEPAATESTVESVAPARLPETQGKLRYEDTAVEAHLFLKPSSEWEWVTCEEWAHITEFNYDVRSSGEDGDDAEVLGTVSGYIISHDSSVSDVELWDEADALGSDVAAYVDSLIRELRACGVVFDYGLELEDARRVLIVRHVQPAEGINSADLIKKVVASLVMKETPELTLVDPWGYSGERARPAGKLEGRQRVAALLTLGFVRMVGSRFVWGWNRDHAENLMCGYSYSALLAAKRAGTLEEVLRHAVAEDIYGEGVFAIAGMADLPDPDELMDE